MSTSVSSRHGGGGGGASASASASASSKKHYDLSDFYSYMNSGFDNVVLPEETVKLVCELAEFVGAPSYVKTPVFPIRSLGASSGVSSSGSNGHSSGGDHGSREMSKRGRNKPQEIQEDDWEAIRAFQRTELQKKEGLDAHLDNIRAYLNKITDKTYSDMLQNIYNELDMIIQENGSNSDGHITLSDLGSDSSETMMRVGNSVFQTASSNTFYSAMYARLFKELMDRYAVFKTIFETSLSEFMKLFNKIEYVDSKKDYDKFCEINKVNENRKAMSLFIVNLMKNAIVEPDQVLDIICQLQDLLWENIRGTNRTNEVDEVTENLFIIVNNSHELFSQKEGEFKQQYMNRIQKIEEVSKLKAKSHPSITNKTIFRHMDMMDAINKKKVGGKK